MGETTGHLAQQLVARSMAQRIVHELEAVEIEEQGREQALLAIVHAIDRVLQALQELAAVGQAGERVMRRLMAQLAIGPRHALVIGAATGRHVGVEDAGDQRDGQDAEGGDGDRYGQPAVFDGKAALADGARGDHGGGHARVVHAGNGAAHDHGGAKPRAAHMPMLRAAQDEGQPQRAERGGKRDEDRHEHRHECVGDIRRDFDGVHAQVVHGDDAEGHHGAAQQMAPQAQSLAAGDVDGKSGGEYGNAE